MGEGKKVGRGKHVKAKCSHTLTTLSHTHSHTQRLVAKKKQFYRMKVHHTRQLAVQQCRPLKQRLAVTTEATYSRMRALYRQLKTVRLRKIPSLAAGRVH